MLSLQCAAMLEPIARSLAQRVTAHSHKVGEIINTKYKYGNLITETNAQHQCRIGHGLVLYATQFVSMSFIHMLSS